MFTTPSSILGMSRFYENPRNLPSLGVRPVTAADDATYPRLQSILEAIFGKRPSAGPVESSVIPGAFG